MVEGLGWMEVRVEVEEGMVVEMKVEEMGWVEVIEVVVS